MSEIKHTPGPWRPCNTEEFMFGAQRGNGTEPIGFVYGPAFPERSAQGRRALADVRLIAAAPDLLAALIGLLYQCERVGMTTRDDQPFLDDAYSAIQKATGDS